jgi:hypothetical protein
MSHFVILLFIYLFILSLLDLELKSVKTFMELLYSNIPFG